MTTTASWQPLAAAGKIYSFPRQATQDWQFQPHVYIVMCYSLSPYAGKEIVKIAYMVTGFGMWDIWHIANLAITTHTTYSQNNTYMTKSRGMLLWKSIARFNIVLLWHHWLSMQDGIYCHVLFPFTICRQTGSENCFYSDWIWHVGYLTYCKFNHYNICSI